MIRQHASISYIQRKIFFYQIIDSGTVILMTMILVIFIVSNLVSIRVERNLLKVYDLKTINICKQ